jgi:hypothetical protein
MEVPGIRKVPPVTGTRPCAVHKTLSRLRVDHPDVGGSEIEPLGGGSVHAQGPVLRERISMAASGGLLIRVQPAHRRRDGAGQNRGFHLVTLAA